VEELLVETRRRTELVDVTAPVREAVAAAGAGRVAVLFVPHTTVGLVVQAAGESATKVAVDLERAFERLVAEEAEWEHTAEGDRNPWAHVRAALTATSLTIPLVDGEPALSPLQAIFLCEFDGPRPRRLLVDVL
jgi:secondary thiamine-phosphate synthase enzyme